MLVVSQLRLAFAMLMSQQEFTQELCRERQSRCNCRRTLSLEDVDVGIWIIFVFVNILPC